jgi:hypothetical protein
MPTTQSTISKSEGAAQADSRRTVATIPLWNGPTSKGGSAALSVASILWSLRRLQRRNPARGRAPLHKVVDLADANCLPDDIPPTVIDLLLAQTGVGVTIRAGCCCTERHAA